MKIVDPLPVLSYNSETKTYEISSYNTKYAEEIQAPTYQVGRLKIIIEDPILLENIYGKKLDYINDVFVIY